mgnify:CR=1 FL=1
MEPTSTTTAVIVPGKVTHSDLLDLNESRINDLG